MDDLDVLVIKIFDIIPAYYDKNEAEQIKELIKEYIQNKKNSQ
ncbi:hypothetical protein [Clostridium tagluense]|nr:hypothetical protein [Clostridium tagluense]